MSDRERSPERATAPPTDDDAGKLFIGNLSFETRNEDLHDAFAKIGPIKEARVVTDRESGRPRGFGFVTFESAADADSAIAELNGVELQGRNIRVDRPAPRNSAPRRDFGGDRRGGGGDRRGGFGGDRGGGYGGGGDRSCHDFQRGNCRFGDSCKFSHGGSGGGGGGGRDRDRGNDRGSRGFERGGDRSYSSGDRGHGGGDRGYDRGDRGRY